MMMQEQQQQQHSVLAASKAMLSKPVTTFRAFFAVEIPKELQQKIGEILYPLQRDAKFRRVRWAKLENLHITLRFLGNITQEQYEAMVPKVRAILEPFPGFEVELTALRYFPSMSKPRVLILQPASIAKLAELAILIDKVVVECGVKPETKPFAPHLTLGRLDHMRSRPPELKPIALPKMAFAVDEVVFLRSDPGPKGSLYTPLHKIKLQK